MIDSSLHFSPPPVAPRRRWARALGALVLVLLTLRCDTSRHGDGVPEEVVRQNILGTSYLGQQKWADAAAAFRRALEVRPDDPLLLNNVAVALIQQGEIEQARSSLLAALDSDSSLPHAHYNLGLVEKNDGEFEKAAAHFEAVAAHDPDDLLTQYNLGVVLSRIGREEEAQRAFRKALALDPGHVSTLYGLGRFLLQRGQAQEGTRLITLSQEIRARSGLDEAVGSQYGEQGPYAMGAEYSGDALAAPPAIRIEFESVARAEAALDAAAPMTLTRLEPDGLPAVALAGGQGLSILQARTLSRVPLPAGPTDFEIRALTSGDLDNDGIVELVVLATSTERTVLRRVDQDAGGVWRWGEGLAFVGPTPAAAGLASADMVLVDRDHDGDLDLFACWTGRHDAESSGCLLATNDGSGSFEVRGVEDHGFAFDADPGSAVQVAFSDMDNDRDVDLLVGSADGVQLFTNQRDGSFEDISDRSGLGHAAAGTRSLRVADIDKDGWMDLVLGRESGIEVRPNHGGRLGPPAALLDATDGGTGVVVFDHDNDGFLDLLQSSAGGPRLHRNLGAGRWEAAVGLEGTRKLISPSSSPAAALDADGDGDLDLIVRDGGAVVLLSNEGGNANRWIAIDSRGVGDNRFGVGAKVEVLAGALRQKSEITGPLPLHAGLGRRERVDSLRYLWPGGVLQDEVDQPTATLVEVRQLDRKGTSCPLLYAWRDGGWRFVTDFLGGAAVGYRLPSGGFNTPDTDEYVKIEGGLTEDDRGRLRLRLNNQLEEVLWFDQVELLAVDHPAGTQVFPNERLMPGPPWPAFELFASREVRPLVSARGVEDGRDLSDLLRAVDRRFVDDFDLLPFKGYATPHTIELDLGRFAGRRRVVLLLDGWIDYADSSSNLAAAQAGAALVTPRLRVADGRGGWSDTGHLMGFPAGLPKTMAVELTGLFPTADHRVRIETTMRIYWDAARVLLGGEDHDLRLSRLAPIEAQLRQGGFPAQSSPDGRPPYGYDAQRVSSVSTWKAHAGHYTGFGEVTGLLAEIDDRLVTTRNGDEIELWFDAPLPPGAGWTRTYLLYADGFGKDMDLNSAASSDVGPVPFHDMPAYPYPESVSPPARAVQGQAGTMRRVLRSERGWSGARPQPLLGADPAPGSPLE